MIVRMLLLRILRLRIVVVALVAIALLWWGRGLALRERGEPDPTQTASSAVEPGPAPGAEPEAPAVAPTHPEVAPEAARGGELGVASGNGATSGDGAAESSAASTPNPETSTSTRPEEDGEAAADRRGAGAEQVRIAWRAGRFAEAFAGLADGNADVAEVEAARRALERAVQDLGRSVRAGSFHAVLDWLRRAEGRRCAPVREALDALCEEGAWPRLRAPGEGTAARTVVDPAPSPRLSGRLVRLSVEVRSPARVLEVTGDKAMLRVLSPDGVTFPERAVHELEPDAVTAEEAAELGLAAVVAGDEAAARVWAAIACARSATRSSRLAQLLDLLPNP